jgi:hypothetical protein
VSAFGAFDSNCWERPKFLLLLTYHGDKLLRSMLYDFADFGFDLLAWFLFFVSTLRTHKHQGYFFARLGFFRLKAGTAFWTEFHGSLLRYPFLIPFAWSLLNLF